MVSLASDFGEANGAFSRALSSSMDADPMEADEDAVLFTCRCSNVVVYGRTTGDTASDNAERPDSGLEEIWLKKGAEKQKYAVYVGYDVEAERKSRRASYTTEGESSSTAKPVWRICWMCDTKLYRTEGRRRNDPAVEGATVTIDRNSGILLQTSDRRADPTPLPYSGLNLPVSCFSTFGRPPTDSLKISHADIVSNHSLTHLPSVPDPFFLPPPFMPSHPHLRDLCSDAVDFLNATHEASELQIRAYIEVKAREMRELEEQVRCEVEHMWERYVQGPGRDDVKERERRRSESLGASRDRKGKGRDRGGFGNGDESGRSSGVSPTPMDNPIMREAARAQAQTGASLLSASISQASYMPRPTPIPDNVDNTIDEITRTYNKQGDQRAMAMSYVLSSMDGAMGKSTARDEAVESETVKDVHGRDSWVDEERTEAWRREQQIVEAENKAKQKSSGEGADGKTPMPKASALVGSRKERRGSFLDEARKAKAKAKVSFEEPVAERVDDGLDEEFGSVTRPKMDQEDDDYVFDFELEDRTVLAAPPTADDIAGPSFTATRELEATLASTYASHAPSHRSAHHKLLAGGKDNYTPTRRADASSGTQDESSISKLATSVPMPIGFGIRGITPRAPPYAFERKTSLSDREGMLVPPLMKAMRQRGVLADGNSLGLSSPSQGADVTPRTKPGGEVFRADPGAVLGAMEDDVPDDEDGEGGEGVGSLRENKGFVPPHVLARKESLKSGDVGWRSMVAE